MTFIDTHAHLDGPEYAADRAAVMQRAREAGVTAVFIPAVDEASVKTVIGTCRAFPDFAFPMIGLHPEEVKGDYCEVLQRMENWLETNIESEHVIAIGEVGIDYYWSREFQDEQIDAFERQVQWAVKWQLPLMIHCRKGQAEVMRVLRRYERHLVGGVFHCFTGNEQEAAELLSLRQFVLGIGGVLTFKKSHLPETLSKAVPLSRVVLETDSPYMAPVPLRGQRNESAYITHVIKRMAEAYGVGEQEVEEATNRNVKNLFKRFPA